jgi:hypothetical protein
MKGVDASRPFRKVRRPEEGMKQQGRGKASKKELNPMALGVLNSRVENWRHALRFDLSVTLRFL